MAEGGQTRLDKADLSDEEAISMGYKVGEVLLVPDSPFLATLRMQLQMEEVFQKQKRAVEEELNAKYVLPSSPQPSPTPPNKQPSYRKF